MKKLFIFFIVLVTSNWTIASVNIIALHPKASEIFLPVGKTGKNISLLDISQIKIKDYEKLSGEKMNFFQRIGFKITQGQLRKSINKNGYFSNRKSEIFFTRAIEGKRGFHAGGFFLGFFSWFMLFIGGIVIAYLIKDDKRKSRIKWAWIGFASAFVLTIIVALLLLGLGVIDVGIGF